MTLSHAKPTYLTILVVWPEKKIKKLELVGFFELDAGYQIYIGKLEIIGGHLTVLTCKCFV